MTMPSFILPANGKATPQSVERKRRMAQTLMEQGMQTGPIGHWSQGLARMAQALSGGLASRKADQQDAALQAETKREQMARQLVEDNWRTEGRDHEWGQDAFNNARMVGQDAMQRTTFQNQLDDRQTKQDQLASQQGLYESMTDESVINQTAPGSHPNGMQGPMQPDWTPEQFNQAQMYAAGGDYGKASELLNPIPEVGKPTDDMREYQAAIQQGFQGSLQDWIIQGKKASAQSININGGDGNFDKELSKGIAGVYTSAMEAGQNAMSTKTAAQQLRVLMNERGGALDGLAAAAAPYLPEGAIPEGTNDVVAAQAIIAGLVPKQRVPGSGTTSDFDAKKFSQSLPNIWNQPGGNEIILNTMESYADYQMAVSNVVADVGSDPTITNKAAEIRKRIQEVPDPFIGWKEYMRASTAKTGGGADLDQRLQRYK